MKLKPILLILLTAFFFSLAGLPFIRAQGPDQFSAETMGKIDPRLLKTLLNEEDALIPIIIEMKTEANLNAASKMVNPVERRNAMMISLQSAAESAQAEVKALLTQAARQQQAANIRPLWIVNAVAAEASPATILSLGAMDDVALVRADSVITLPDIAFTKFPEPAAGQVEWGIEKIEADQVWQSLGIDGSGIVVANIDTGVDYLHPNLQTRYRGYNGPNLPALHYGNWFDTTGSATLYPVDGNGHGTHTMGTMVGQDGIGAAPGAKWIAVKTFNTAGSAQESWIHSAFEWILAPEGDPALAPDVVNNSWGNNIGSNTAFEGDVQVLLDAGIIPIFSAGNAGPNPVTIGAPASYDISFAVGAADSDDIIANFSSRGPSPWGKIKPEVTAPGVNVLSALPGGAFGTANGTSMAAPHVSGITALLLEADNSLSYAEISQILTATARRIEAAYPNNTYGWGLVNAYSAVETALDAGLVTGVIRNSETSEAVAGVKVTFIPRNTGLTNTVTTDNTGFYRRGLAEGDYTATASAFGYTPQSKASLSIAAGQVISQNFSLAPLPTGSASGFITEAESNRPLAATITVNQTPVTATTNPNGGGYIVDLPVGVYTLTVTSPGHRVGIAKNIAITPGETTIQNMALFTAPTILLIDSGAWYNGSQISFYQQALDDLQYYYHTHPIKTIPDDTPTSATLNAYDVVIWSSPLDSPGLSGSGGAIEQYLDGGGNFLLSGQDVAYFDGGGTLLFSPYYFSHMLARFLDETTPAETITAVPDEIFDGLAFTISGGDGANNQTAPDIILNRDPDFASEVLNYQDGGNAGQRIGHCLPYQAINLPFGLEAVSNRETRAQLLEASLNWFQSPSPQTGFEASPALETLTGNFGATVTHTFRIRNEAEVGAVNTYTLSLGGHQWAVNMPYTRTTLAPCQSAELTFTVNIPTNVSWNEQDILTISIQSTLSPTEQSVITRVTKAPSPVLLVDDDRWYNFEDDYFKALNANGIQPDYWSVRGDTPGDTPPLKVLQRYPVVIWFTAYDWFSPLEPDEEEIIKQYLDGGGRLFFAGQEYLYNLPDHKPSQFAQDYFGIYTYTEEITTATATGLPGNPIGDGLGPYPLTFPLGYQNWTDSVTPTQSADAAMINQKGLANAISNRGGITETWRTAFFAFGPELLNDAAQAELMRRIVGWLNWLGASTVSPDKTTAAAGDIITYTGTLRNDGLSELDNVAFTATFTAPLSLVSGSATGGAVENAGQVIWTGSLAKNQAVTITYQAAVSSTAPYGLLSRQVSWIRNNNHGFTFDRAPAVAINMPNWEGTTAGVSPIQAALNENLTYTLRLLNTGLADAPLVTATGQIPSHLWAWPVTATQGTGSLGTGSMGGGQLTWHTPVSKNTPITLTFGAQVIAIPYPFTFPLAFELDDGTGRENRWTVYAGVKPYATYLPLVLK